MNRIDRLMAMILLLQSRRVITGEEMAAHFEVSTRTIYRDIAAISEGGVPVVAEAGVGYSLLQGYSLPPVMLTAEEANALFLGGQLVEHLTDRSLQTQVQTALLKIRAVLPRSHQEQIDQLRRTTAVLAHPPGGASPGGALLTRIQAALALKRVLRIQYLTRGQGPPTRRDLEPLGLLYYGDRWHLIGFCRLRADFRDFRIDRIVDLAVLDERFHGHSHFSLHDHVQSWRESCERQEVVVRVHRMAADRFRRGWMGAATREHWQGDWLEIAVQSDLGGWLTGWLLGFGTALRVVAPEVLRRRLAAEAQAVAEWHDVDSDPKVATAGVFSHPRTAKSTGAILS